MKRDPEKDPKKMAETLRIDRAPYLEASVIAGVAAGATTGLLAGPPGVVAGSILGAAVGAAVGRVLDREEHRRELHEEELDREIGVIEGEIGSEPQNRISHPPPREKFEFEDEEG